MYASTYLLVNTFCILILLIILHSHMQNLDKSYSARIFQNVLITTIIYVVFDILCGLADNDVVVYPRPLSMVINVGFYYVSYLISYLCFLYAECELQSKWVEDKKKRMLYAIPTVLLFIITPLTLKWKFFFYIDEGSNYIKGPLYFPMLILVYGHLLVIGAKALIMLPQKKYYAMRQKIATLSSFVVLPLLAGAIQAFFNGISIVCMGCTLAAVQVFINMQKTKITVDSLTELNNRSKMMQHLERCMAQSRTGAARQLYLLMLDVDGFKQINDKFGHLEGDRALIRLAAVLKKAAAHEKCLISRFGGDEFAIVLETEEGMEETFIHRLSGLLALANDAEQLPYKLEVSIGCARFTPEITTIPDLIRKADKDLYRDKASKASGTA